MHNRDNVASTPPMALSILEAAKALGVSRNTIFGLFASGELPYLRVGRRRLVPVDALAAFIELKTIAKGKRGRVA